MGEPELPSSQKVDCRGAHATSPVAPKRPQTRGSTAPPLQCSPGRGGVARSLLPSSSRSAASRTFAIALSAGRSDRTSKTRQGESDHAIGNTEPHAGQSEEHTSELQSLTNLV